MTVRRLGTADEVDLASVYAYPERLPWLRANMIAGADGAAWRDGKAGGLGNATDQRLLSLLRALSDVVIVGARTVRVEGYGPLRPRKSWREVRAGRPPAPRLAIVSARLDLDFDAPVFTEAPVPTVLVTCDAAPEDRLRGAVKHAEVIVAGDESVDLGRALDALAERGHTRQLTEGGPRLLARCVAAGRLDELCLTVSPLLSAGDAARILDGPVLAEAMPLRLAHVLEEDGFLYLRYLRSSTAES